MNKQASLASQEYTDEQRKIRGILLQHPTLSAARVDAIMSGIVDADAALNNACVPTYSAQLLAMSDLCDWVEATGVQKMQGLSGMRTKPLTDVHGMLRLTGVLL